MQLTSVLSILALAAPSFAAHVLHEKREWVPAGWVKGARLEPHTLMPMRIALTQQNMHRIDEYLNDVSLEKAY